MTSSGLPGQLWLCDRALALSSSYQQELKYLIHTCYMKAERKSLAEAFAGAIIEFARGGPAEDIGKGVPGHRAAVALAHGHIFQLVPARDKCTDERKHDSPARDLSRLHSLVASACTRG